MALTPQQLAAYIGRFATADSLPALHALAHDIRASDGADEAAVLLRLIAHKAARIAWRHLLDDVAPGAAVSPPIERRE